MERRPFLLGSIGAIVAAAGVQRWNWRTQVQDGLRYHAASRGILYGAAINTGELDDPGFAGAVAAECGLLVPANALKFEKVASRPDGFDFGPADKIFDFAMANKMQFRGHTLLWWKQVPGWVTRTVSATNADSILARHIGTVVGHYKGRAQSWDVVNEALDPKSLRPDGLNDSIWLRLLGPDYIARAFHLAHEADPSALLTYNENNMDYDNGYCDRKRAMVLDLLTRLVKDGVPVGGLGIQAHLSATEGHFNPRKYQEFLAAIAGLGLKVIISELDVRDDKVDGADTDRDSRVAEIYGEYLAAALAQPAVIAVVTWGLSDTNSWLNKQHPRFDGAPLRPLILDPSFKRKPSWSAMAHAFDTAPSR